MSYAVIIQRVKIGINLNYEKGREINFGREREDSYG